MINIILVCNAGMSTSVLVKKMRDESEKEELIHKLMLILLRH